MTKTFTNAPLTADGNPCRTVDLELRISLAETDQVGVVYFANYLTFFEKGHHQFFRVNGIDNRAMITAGIYTPIRESHCRYLVPLQYDDPFIIRTTLRELLRSKMTFDYEILHADSGQLAASGYTIHSFANARFMPTRLPAPLATALGCFLTKKDQT